MTDSKRIRWTASRKRELVASIFSGERSTEQALGLHPDLSPEELKTWMDAYETFRGDQEALSQDRLIIASAPSEEIANLRKARQEEQRRKKAAA